MHADRFFLSFFIQTINKTVFHQYLNLHLRWFIIFFYNILWWLLALLEFHKYIFSCYVVFWSPRNWSSDQMETSKSSMNGYEDLLHIQILITCRVLQLWSGCRLYGEMMQERSYTLPQARLTGAGKQTPLVLMTTNIIDFMYFGEKHAALSYFKSYTIA